MRFISKKTSQSVDERCEEAVKVSQSMSGALKSPVTKMSHSVGNAHKFAIVESNIKSEQDGGI